jgi:hypothetical protein
MASLFTYPVGNLLGYVNYTSIYESEQYVTILEKLAKGNKPTKSLGRRGVLGLQVGVTC